MKNKMKTLLVDDEPLALDYLNSMLSAESDLDIVGRCRNGKDALTVLRNQSIDLVFLDVQMPVMSGLEVVANCQADVMPMVVFVTAYDQYALEAFDLNAVDYLLKPLDPERLERALARIRERWFTNTLLNDKSAAVSALRQLQGHGKEPGIAPAGTERSKLPIKDGGQTYLVPLDDIHWIDAAGDYMCVHAQGQTHILRSTMKELEQRLSAQFARIHRSTIANLTKVSRVEARPKGECLLHLADGATLKVSRNYRSEVQHLLV